MQKRGSLRIAMGADHGGFSLKEELKSSLLEKGYDVEDCGTVNTEPVDYPTFAHEVARRVSDRRADVGIVIDRAGIGSAMAANKIPGVRAALCYDLSSARNSREHNNANVLTLGAGLVGPDLARQIVEVWLSTECTVDRHLRRAAMIESRQALAAQSGAVRSSEARPVETRHPAGHSHGSLRTPEGSCHCRHRHDSDMENLTDQDVERIVRRVVELSGSSAPDDCTNPACVMCRVCAGTNPDFVRQLVGLGADRVGHAPGGGILPDELAKYIDHTLLRPDATRHDIEELCAEAEKYEFASVCVHPGNVHIAAKRLAGTSVKVCSVVGFPHGANMPEIKALETRRAIRDGAREIDMVINIGALKSGNDEWVYRDIRGVTDACMDGGAICKVILETALLTDDEKVRACHCAKRARAHFVKTSTGFGGGGATAHDVALMAQAVSGTKMKVKASGGIRTYEDAQKMIQAGATRLGASAGVKIMAEAKGVTVSDSPAAAKYSKY